MSRVSIIQIMLCCILIIVNGCASASSSECLAESDHPYANNFKDTWTISEPGASQIRLHFENLELGNFDNLYIFDEYDNRLKRYYLTDGKDFWTEWYTGDTLKVKLVTDESGTDYGFRIDYVDIRTDSSEETSKDIQSTTGEGEEVNIETDTSTESQNLEKSIVAESDHPYANNFKDTWTISEPGASQIRLHFENLELGNFDNLYIFDESDNRLKRYYLTDGKDFWTEWYTGDTLKVKLVTDESGTDYGFRIDKLETRLSEPNNSSETSGTNTLTATELTSSANPSELGKSVTLAAKVDAPSQAAEKPSGTVNFMDGSTLIGTEDVNSGRATLTTSLLSSGSHSITAEYSGDNNFKSSKSPAFTLTVLEQPSSEESLSTEEQALKIGQNVSTEQTNTEPSQTDKEPIWENPIFSGIISGIIATVVGGLIVNNCPPLKDKVRSFLSKFRK